MTASRIWCRRGASAGIGAVVDALAFDVKRTAPVAVMVTVEAEVEPDPEVGAGVAERFDRDGASGTVGHREVKRAAEDAPVGGVVAQVRSHRSQVLDRAVRVHSTVPSKRRSS